MKIGSHKEKDKLAKAKKEVYLKGFYSGVLSVGQYAGQKVMDVKDKIKEELIKQGQAARYFEPESRVVARSGDECVVALCDQWYLKYGDEDWTRRVKQHVDTDFNMFSDSALNDLSYAVGWLGDWACSRTFGLGTKLPWDEKWLIESLSDSTVYMAYYTVSHLIEGESGIRPEDLTEEVFDFIFCLRDEPPAETPIAQELLQKMRGEFSFWYPLDLRCSGKDLIRNHLTMSLFNHAAVWEDASLWPRAFYCNGFVMVDSEKMSKSKGNFLTLKEAIDTYSADAVRITCADSGDGLSDANFSRDNCGKTILRLNALQGWATEMVSRLPSLRSGDKNFIDNIVSNKIKSMVEEAYTAYEGMVYSDALRAIFYDIDNLRSQYSILTNDDVHAEVIREFLEAQMIALSPIAPHFCEHAWQKILGKTTLVVQERWPRSDIDSVLLQQYDLIQGILRGFRLELDKFCSPGKKKKGSAAADPQKPNGAVIFVSSGYKQWQQDVFRFLQTFELDPKTNEPLDGEYMRKLKDADFMKAVEKQDMKKVMPFASHAMKTEVKARGREALELELPFDESGMLQDLQEVIKLQLRISTVEIVDADVEHPRGGDQKRSAATPGKPQILFFAEALEAA